MSSASRILVVEDDPSTAQLFKRWLATAGYEVVLAPTAENGLSRLAQSSRWDMVLTDVDLPGCSGLDLLRTLRERMPRLPVLLTTGHRSMEIASAAVGGGALGFLLKPMDKQTLLERVEGVFHWVAQSRVVLAIGANPNNVELGCGGALLRHRQAGHQVVILILSRGNGASLTVEEEASNAARRLGAALYTDVLDKSLPSDATALSQTIRRVVQSCNPTWIYTHCAEDTHPHHRQVYRATLAAAPQVANLFCYQTQSSSIDFHPNRFVEIEKQIGTKQQALQAYVSQMSLQPSLQPDMVQANAVYWGRFAGYRMVEPFSVVREEPTYDSPFLPAIQV